MEECIQDHRSMERRLNHEIHRLKQENLPLELAQDEESTDRNANGGCARNLSQNAESYNQHIRHEWIQSFHWRLPREIRDMIYSLLAPYEVKLDLRDQWWIEPREAMKSLLDENFGSLSQATDPSIVGQKFAIELAEMCYKQPRFIAVGPLAAIPAFFETDMFGLNMDPYAYVQHFDVVIARSLQATRVNPSKIDRQHLEVLKQLKCKNAVNVKIEQPRSPRAYGLLDSLEAISKWYHEMLEHGFNLKVSILMGDRSLDLNRYFRSSIVDFKEWQQTWPRNPHQAQNRHERMALQPAYIAFYSRIIGDQED